MSTLACRIHNACSGILACLLPANAARIRCAEWHAQTGCLFRFPMTSTNCTSAAAHHPEPWTISATHRKDYLSLTLFIVAIPRFDGAARTNNVSGAGSNYGVLTINGRPSGTVYSFGLRHSRDCNDWQLDAVLVCESQGGGISIRVREASANITKY